MLELRRELFPSRLVLAWLVAVATLAAVGTAAYIAFEHWSLSDALYMTIITITSVGFKEVGPLDGAGRAITAALALCAVVLIFGTVGIVSEIVASAALRRSAEERTRHTVNGMQDHYLVAGYGRVGSTVARELTATGAIAVVVEADPAVAAIAREAGLAVIHGDATDDETLRLAGVERAKGLVAALDSDANNLYVVLSARELNPGLFVVTRATSAAAEAKLRRAGADRVVSPYEMAGHRLAALVRRPRVVEFIDAAMRGGAVASYALEELAIEEGSRLVGVTLSELIGRGAAVLAVLDAHGAPLPTMAPDHRLAVAESVILAGPAGTLAALRERA